MNKAFVVALVSMLALAGCDKYGLTGRIEHRLGNWAEVSVPSGCKPKAIAGEEGNGVILLCEDGRIFH